MAKEYSRNKRVAHNMQKEIAAILQSKIQDPRVSMATVSGVKVSRDLAYVKVFITFLNDNTPEQVKTGIQALQDAAGFIRILLGKVICQRVVPELTFTYDNSLVEGIRMADLISKVVKNDRLRYGINSSDAEDIIKN